MKPDFDDSSWRQLNLPHDWAIEGPFNIDYDGATGKLPYWGIRWYRKTIDLPQEDEGKQIYLDIDGAMSYASVWCNGNYVGGWPYGYTSFRLDLTPYLKIGQRNVLAIRLDNPNDASRWYPGGGIYRNVWLVKASPVHVSQWGTSVRNVKVTREEATMECRFVWRIIRIRMFVLWYKPVFMCRVRMECLVGKEVSSFRNEGSNGPEKEQDNGCCAFLCQEPAVVGY